MKEMNLDTIRKIQNNIYYDDCYDVEHEQPFLYFLGNHPYLFEEFIDSGHLTQAEMYYIIDHFNDYTVDPRTFEREFKRALREALPRYNWMKSIELIEDVFDLVDDKFQRQIYSARATSLAQNGSKNSSTNSTSNADTKEANRQEPMESTGATFDGTVSWSNGASNIAENKVSGSANITQADTNALVSNGTDNGNSTETYNHHGNPVEHIDKIWNYLLKPKAIEYLTSELQYAFNMVY